MVESATLEMLMRIGAAAGMSAIAIVVKPSGTIAQILGRWISGIVGSLIFSPAVIHYLALTDSPTQVHLGVYGATAFVGFSGLSIIAAALENKELLSNIVKKWSDKK